LYLGPSTRCSCLPSIEIDAALLGDTDHDGVAVHNRLVHRPCLRVFSFPPLEEGASADKPRDLFGCKVY
jgi:hypothetical protein